MGMPIRGPVLVAALALSGCAALANTFEDEPKNKVYVCVRQDFTGWTFAHGGFIDWPFSLVLDTILLPYTIPVTIGNYATDDAVEPAPDDEGVKAGGGRCRQSSSGLPRVPCPRWRYSS